MLRFQAGAFGEAQTPLIKVLKVILRCLLSVLAMCELLNY